MCVAIIRRAKLRDNCEIVSGSATWAGVGHGVCIGDIESVILGKAILINRQTPRTGLKGYAVLDGDRFQEV